MAIKSTHLQVYVVHNVVAHSRNAFGFHGQCFFINDLLNVVHILDEELPFLCVCTSEALINFGDLFETALKTVHHF